MFDFLFNEAVATTVQVVVGAALGGLISTLVHRYKERRTLEDKIEALTNAIKETREDFRREIEKVRADLLVEINGLKAAESANLRNTIRYSAKNRIRDGFISLDEKDDILNCAEAYHSIVDPQKNGVIEDLIHQLRELPNIKTEDTEK